MNRAAAPAASDKQILKPTKKNYEDLFVQACWIHYVWDRGNKRALRYIELAQQQLNDAWCVRASHQIRDLDLRHRWLQAKYDQVLAASQPDPDPVPISLPRVTPAVRRHLEREFEKTYPKGVRDPEIDTL